MTTSATTSNKTTSPGEEEYLISRVAIIYYLRFPFPLFFYNDNKKNETYREPRKDGP